MSFMSNWKRKVAVAANVKVLCDVAVSMHHTFNLQIMFNQGTNAKFCTSPAILQNTCYSQLFLIKWIL